MWLWLLISAVILVLGAGWLFLLAREVFRKGMRLFDEIAIASDRASEAASATNTDQRRPTMRSHDSWR